MATARKSVPRDTTQLWVHAKALYIGNFPDPRHESPSQSYLRWLITSWSGNEVGKLKLNPRQYGAVKQGDQLEEIMAEFRPYPRCLKQNSRDEYQRRRLQTTHLAQMSLSIQDGELPTSFSSINFWYLSEFTNLALFLSTQAEVSAV